MSFLSWLEASGLGEWVRSSTIGYPMMITCHAIGMTIMVGLSVILDLRLLGRFAQIPYQMLQRFLGVAWAGFGINFLSGAALFAAQATTYITDFMFLLKMTLVVAGAITVALLQPSVGRQAVTSSGEGAPASVRRIALASLVCWFGATTAGRLIAYL